MFVLDQFFDSLCLLEPLIITTLSKFDSLTPLNPLRQLAIMILCNIAVVPTIQTFLRISFHLVFNSLGQFFFRILDCGSRVCTIGCLAYTKYCRAVVVRSLLSILTPLILVRHVVGWNRTAKAVNLISHSNSCSQSSVVFYWAVYPSEMSLVE